MKVILLLCLLNVVFSLPHFDYQDPDLSFDADPFLEQQGIINSEDEIEAEHENAYSPQTEHGNLYSSQSEQRSVYSPHTKQGHAYSPHSKQGQAHSSHTERGNLYSSQSDQISVYSPHVKQGHGHSSHAEQGHAYSPHIKQGHAHSSHTEQGHAHSSQKEQGHAHSSHTEQAHEHSQAEPIAILKDDRKQYSDGTFSFDFETEDGIFRSESGGPYAREGSVSFTFPSGETFDLNFIADENGYQPDSKWLPVAPDFPHPIPQYVLDQISKAQREDAEAEKYEYEGDEQSLQKERNQDQFY